MNKWYDIKNKNEDIGEIYIYGDIEDWKFVQEDVTPIDFINKIKALGEIKTLNIYINSPGGSVFAGQAIYNIIKRQKAQTNVYIDGIAASIASIIALAGDKVYMANNSLYMIHLPFTIALGNSDDFRKLADTLDKVTEISINVYEEKTGLERKEIKEMLKNETWMTADEALEKGFIDEIQDEKNITASMRNGELYFNNIKMDFSKFKNAPQVKETKKVINITSEIDMLKEKIEEKKNKYKGV